MSPLQWSDQRLTRLYRQRWFAPLAGALLLGLALWVMTRGWDHSLLDRYQFRQTQTALNAYWMQHEEFHLAYPLPVFGPPWSVPYEFPLYQWLVARLSGTTGLELVSSARVVGILFFLLSLPAVWGLAELIEPNPRRRLFVPAAVLVTPVCLFYSRTFLIESCACTLAVWFLHAHVRNLRGPNWRWTTATAVLGVLAALVKVTTFFLFGTAAVAYTLFRLLQVSRQRQPPGSPGVVRLLVASAIPGALALVAGMWWVRFTDAVKHANPYADMLTSANLKAWHFGTVAMRLDSGFWRQMYHELSIGALSGWMLAILGAVSLVVAPRYRWSALLCASGFLLGPLIFANLYYIHEYYFFPSAYFAAAAAGILLVGLVATPRLGFTAKAVIAGALLLLQAVNFNGYYAFTLRNRPNPAPPLAAVIRAAVPSEEVVLIHGWDWNTLLPYYAERRSLLVPLAHEDDSDMLLTILGRASASKVSALVVQGPHRQDAAFIHWRTNLLNLSPIPVAQSVDGDLYLPAGAGAPLERKLGDLAAYPAVRFDFSTPPPPQDPRLHRQDVNPAAYAAVASPAPFVVFNPWSVDVAPLDGKTTIFANAPSELHFHAPPGAKSIDAVVGLNDGAYKSEHPTDGVDVMIFELQPDGRRRILYHRYLDPVRHPQDRGPQSISLPDIGPVSGALVFAVYPGPTDNLACDWSYWRQIRIH